MANVILLASLLVAAHGTVLAVALAAGAWGGGFGALVVAVLLVGLPIVGLSRLVPAPKVGLPAAMLLWPLVVLMALPGMLRVSPADAVNVGLSWFGGQCSGVGELAYRVLPAPGAAAPGTGPVVAGVDCPPAAPAPTGSVPPASSLSVSAEDVVIPYTLKGNSIVLPVTFANGRKTVTVPMLFDTGASLTTLDAETLQQLGLRVSSDSPVITTQTAAGPRESQILTLDSVSLNGHTVSDLTISACDPCADDESRGLLGMNVSGRFLITIDTEAEQIVLRPRDGGMTEDIRPWLELETSGLQEGDDLVVSIAVRNRADRSVSHSEIEVSCDGYASVATIVDIPAGGSRSGSTQLTLLDPSECQTYTISLESAKW